MNDSLSVVLRISFLTLFHVALLGIAGCRDNTPLVPSDKPVQAKRELTQAQKIDKVSKVIARNNALPSSILDAQFLEEASAPPDEAGFGPTDYTHYIYFKVAQKDVERWNVLLQTRMGYVPSPETLKGHPWWLNDRDLKNIEFFHPYPMAPRDGWVAFSRKTGEFWIFGFTT